jgi:hypothetical protein
VLGLGIELVLGVKFRDRVRTKVKFRVWISLVLE